VSLNHVQYRILYSFHTDSEGGGSEERTTGERQPARFHPSNGGRPLVRKTVAVLAHSLVKEGKVPSDEIDKALERMTKFAAAPKRHTYAEE
jgi:hypothetical protein